MLVSPGLVCSCEGRGPRGLLDTQAGQPSGLLVGITTPLRIYRVLSGPHAVARPSVSGHPMRATHTRRGRHACTIGVMVAPASPCFEDGRLRQTLALVLAALLLVFLSTARTAESSTRRASALLFLVGACVDALFNSPSHRLPELALRAASPVHPTRTGTVQ